MKQWRQWKPCSGLAQKYTLDTVCDKNKKLKISLFETGDEQNKIEIKFEKSVCLYAITDETLFIGTLGKLGEDYGSKFYSEWSFFKIQNSSYLKRFNSIDSNTSFNHFTFLFSESMVDVVSIGEPKFEFVTQDRIETAPK